MFHVPFVYLRPSGARQDRKAQAVIKVSIGLRLTREGSKWVGSHPSTAREGNSTSVDRPLSRCADHSSERLRVLGAL